MGWMDALKAFGVALYNTTTYPDRQHFLLVSVLSFTPSIVGFHKAMLHTWMWLFSSDLQHPITIPLVHLYWMLVLN